VPGSGRPPTTTTMYYWTWVAHGTPPGTTAAFVSTCALDSPGTPGLGIRFFVSGDDGHLWANCLNEQDNTWSWYDCKMPFSDSQITVGSFPGVLFNSAEAGTRLMVLASEFYGCNPPSLGIYEYDFDPATSTWSWGKPHGNPPGTVAATLPSCALDSVATGVKFFVGGADGNLWENYLDPSSQLWGWTPHGAP